MAVLKPAEFSALVKKNENSNLVFLFGEEKFLIDEQADQLVSRALDGAIEEFNFNSFFSDNVNLVELQDLCDTLPMMAKYRVVRLQINKDFKKADQDKLLSILEKLPETTFLLITAIEMDFKKAFYTKLQKHCQSVRYYSPFPNEISKWINKFIKAESLQIEPDANNLVFELVGGKLADLKDAVTKLKLFLGDSQSLVNTEVVTEVLAKTKQDSVFDFTNWVGKNQRWKALESLKSLKAQGQSEVGILSLLNRHLQNLYITKELLSRGEDRFAIAKALRLPPFFTKDYIEQAKLWPEPKLQASIHALALTDKALKSSPLKSSLWIENFVIKICRN